MASAALGKEGVSSRFDVLIDSDAFVGRYFPKDAHFQAASKFFETLEKKSSRIVTTSMVVAETATVLSHRQGQDLARTFLRAVQASRLPVIHIDEKLQSQA